MRKIQLLAACGLMVAWALGARAMNDIKPAAVTVVNIDGQARYSVDGKSWHPLVAGKILHQGAVVETAAGSSCDLVLSGTPVPFARKSPSPSGSPDLAVAPDPNVRGLVASKPMAQQNIIHMSADTMLAIDKLTVVDTGADTVSDTELDLRAGKIFASVKKMSSSSQYIIKLPNGVAGIRGSSGSLSSDGSAQWLHGEIIISFIGSNGQPHVVVVHGGFEYNPQTGQILHLSPQAIAALERFGAYASTLYAQVYPVAQNLTFIYISPTQGVPTSVTPPASGGP
ncbi:MAG TPA: FecR domain-containing protein [Verrucomicrobiae bacterium]|nr:FecR domain-containing protein [Verrucomicrobiae bacterium]